jgi:hypothetical protein
MADEEKPVESQSDDLDMETELELEDGTVVTVGELLQQAGQAREAAQRISQLEEFRENATRLMRGEEPDADAAYKVLRGAGFSDAEARQYAQEYLEGEAGGEEGDEGDEDDIVKIEKAIRNSTREAETKADKAMREAQGLRLRMLKEEMDRRVVESIDKNPEIVKMLETLDKTRGREHATGAWRALQEQVRENTLKNLYSRRDAAGGQFSEDWVAEEAAKAAKAVAGNYRTVIGDIDSLGRSPETDGELEILKSQKPVPPPEFKKGMERGDVDKDVRSFNVDALSRLAADTGTGGESKV